MFPFFHSYMVIVIVMLRLLLSSFCSHSQNSFKIASHCARGCVKVYLFKHFGLVYKILDKCCLYLYILIVWYWVFRVNISNFLEKKKRKIQIIMFRRYFELKLRDSSQCHWLSFIKCVEKHAHKYTELSLMQIHSNDKFQYMRNAKQCITPRRWTTVWAWFIRFLLSFGWHSKN